MDTAHELIAPMYAAFNRRDIDGVLAFLSDNVSWPMASEGGRVVGKDEIRAYWTRQWAEFDPHVEPWAMRELELGKLEVEVHQIVKSLDGTLLSDQNVLHVYTTRNGLVERMDVQNEGTPSFARDHTQ